jgi:uncharacterized protein
MQRIDGVTIISPTDLANHLACKHLTWLNLKSLETGIAPRKLDDDLLEVLKSYGEEHEATYLAALEASLQSLKRTVVDLDARRDKDSAYTRDELMKRMSTTVAAMKSGPDALYQPTFYSEKDGFGWVGRADFLVAVDEIISQLGNYAFQPYDTKLARIAKVNALIQLCAYAEQIHGVQGLEPEFIHVVTGSEEEGTVSVRLSEVSAYYRRVKQSLVDALLESPEHSEPVPNEHCDVCRWRAECKAYWRKADDLTFVAGMSATNREKLRAVGITKLEELANRNEVKTDINPDVLSRLRRQATLQLITKSKQEIDPETLPETEFLRPVERGRGFSLLPEKNVGDIFYDIEGHAYRGSKGLEYLHGLAWVDTDGTQQYKAIWAHDAEEERKALIEVIDFINSRIAMPGHENLRIYHFGHYEPSALKRLATRHVTCETELSKLLREGRFVDLSRIVTQGMRIGVESYSIKKLERMYGFKRNDLVEEGKLSIVCYEDWLASRSRAEYAPEGNIKHLDDLKMYNKNDCFSTIELRNWLESQRALLAEALPIPELNDLVRPSLNKLEDEPRIGDGLAEQLNAGRFDRLPEDQASLLEYKWLLADLLDFHEREDAVSKFEFIQLRGMTQEELFENSNTIAGLKLESAGDIEEPTGKKKLYSQIRRYRFDPSQTTTIALGKQVTAPNYHPYLEPGAEKPAFPSLEVVSLDLDHGVIELRLKFAKSLMQDPTAIQDPTAVFLNDFIDKSVFVKGLEEIATSVLSGNEAELGATIGLLKRVPTKLQKGSAPIGAVEVDREWRDMSSIVQSLDGSYIAIQGPPGTGKTYSAANMILDLVKRGKRVGITANTHGAVRQLLDEIVVRAGDHGLTGAQPVTVIVGTGKPDSESEAGSIVMIARREKNEKVAKEQSHYQIVAGTSFLFARSEMRESVDVLFVDEAGQLSLADTLAVSLATKDLVLVGDPQQLKQPTKAAHPGESGLSALEYINHGRDVVPEGYGILLSTTKRMHPSITAFVSEQVYEGKLHSAPGLERQAVSGTDWLSGSGLRWWPVEHSGRTTVAPEEATHVVETFYSMLGRDFTNKDGLKSTIAPEDVFLIAPYNMQRTEILRKLASHADAKKHGVTEDLMRNRVGTVDKAQGDEAPVVLMSFTSSSAEDISHGMAFLYSKNRFNVAVSRARALVVVFASPQLLDVNCKTIEQVRLANMLCRYVEVAESKE